LLVRPNGTELWLYRYRFGSKRENMSFGIFPRVGLKAAREAPWRAVRLGPDCSVRGYVEAIGWESGQPVPDPVKVVPLMVDRFHRDGSRLRQNEAAKRKRLKERIGSCAGSPSAGLLTKSPQIV
jgi:hypothetical protein